MSHTSPAVSLVWALMSCLLGSFLVFHLWSYDRFKCLRWNNNGPYSGAFKRVMTYSYMSSVPLLMTYALGFAIIKYSEGLVFIPGHGVVPKPYQLWTEAARSAIFPLYLVFSVAWSLEMVTHLEELCFWLFLINAASAREDWFRSLYFKAWLFGSFLAITYMPLVTILTRLDVLKCEAYTFLAGSLGSLLLTLWFIPVLWRFPSFLDSLKREHINKAVIIRLTKFHELNILRVLFRFLFVLPLVALGIDGVRTHQHVNESMFWTDLLAMIAGVGCVISSGITLVIFFPRSIESEIAAKEASRENHQVTRLGGSHSQHSRVGSGDPLLITPPLHFGTSQDGFDGPFPISPQKVLLDDRNKYGNGLNIPIMRPNRRTETGDVELGCTVLATLSEDNLSKHSQRMTNMDHLVYTFKSPIDLAYSPRPSRTLPMHLTQYGRTQA